MILKTMLHEDASAYVPLVANVLQYMRTVPIRLVEHKLKTYWFYHQFLIADWLLQNLVGESKTFGEFPDVAL